MSIMPRVQAVVLPILKLAPALAGAKIGSWIENADFRTYPLINVRRAGGPGRNIDRPLRLQITQVEIEVITNVSQVATSAMYDDVLDALYQAVVTQQPAVDPDTGLVVGYISSIYETSGATELSALFTGTYRTQGMVRLGISSPRQPGVDTPVYWPQDWPLVMPVGGDLDFDWDWSDWLAGDEIASCVFTTDCPELTVVSSAFTETSGLVWLSGGSAGLWNVLCSITTAAGRVMSWAMPLMIENT